MAYQVTFDNQQRRKLSKSYLQALLTSRILDPPAEQHIHTALQAIKDLDSRSTNADYQAAFSHAAKHLAYAFRLRVERGPRPRKAKSG